MNGRRSLTSISEIRLKSLDGPNQKRLRCRSSDVADKQSFVYMHVEAIEYPVENKSCRQACRMYIRTYLGPPSPIFGGV